MSIRRRRCGQRHHHCIKKTISPKSCCISQWLRAQKRISRTGTRYKIPYKVIEVLQAEGFLRIELMVEADNEKAIALYQKLGFCIEGTLKQYVKRKDQNHYVDEQYMAWMMS
ncbi:MAG: GNAT family N-acetyltransferase [Deltaproteobacteria bacterium]|nr:GNAT family N-acetyltransferase [Deltaproteobacteria bacterium]